MFMTERKKSEGPELAEKHQHPVGRNGVKSLRILIADDHDIDEAGSEELLLESKPG